MPSRALPFLVPVVALLALGIATRCAQMRSDEFFSRALQEAHAEETVVVRGTQYAVTEATVRKEGEEVRDVERVRALSLAYQKVAAARAPHLSLPDTSPEELRAATAELRRTTRALQERYAPADAPLVGALHPAALVHALAQLEEAREVFLRTGDASDLSAYRAAERDALRAYDDSLSRFAAGFSEAVPDDIRSFAVPSYLITRHDTMSALKDLRDGLAAAKGRLSDSARCDTANIRYCASDVLLPSIAPTNPSAPTAAQLSLAQEILHALERVALPFDAEFGNRMVLLERSACVTRDPDGAPLFALRAIRTYEGKERLVPTYVGNWYFIKVSPQSGASSLPYLESFARGGIEHVPIHPLVYYECPPSATDQGAILAVRDIALFARDRRLSQYAPQGLADTLRALERQLIEGPYAAEADAAAYLREASRLYGIPSEVFQALETLRLRLASRSEGFYASLLDVIQAERTNMMSADAGVSIEFSALNHFFTRNALLVFYGALLEDQAATFPANTLPAEAQPYVRYSSLPSESRARILQEALSFYHSSYEF